MISDRVALICRSFAQAAPQRAAWAAAFDAALLRLNPDASRLFGQSAEVRSRRFATMLALIVESLNRPRDDLYAALGRRHARHGMTEDHYDDAGAALLIALHEVLGERYTDEVEAAWATLYGELVEIMMAAARTPRPPRDQLSGGVRINLSTIAITINAPTMSTPHSNHCL